MRSGIVLFVIISVVVLLTGAIAMSQPHSGDADIVISFDLEFPYSFTSERSPLSEEQWMAGMDRILEIAEEEDVHFQFFVLGKNAETYPVLLKRIEDEGHGIGCHSYEHADQKTLTYTEKLEQVSKCKRVVESIIDGEIAGNRFPMTAWEENSFRALKEAGYEYDSSVWEMDTAPDVGIKEYYISNVFDDWTFYIFWGKTNSKEMYNQIYRRILTGQDTVIIHHPWVLAEDSQRLDDFRDFVYVANIVGNVKTFD